MGYFKEQVIDTMDEFDALLDGFVERLAPLLSETFCDESPGELLALWDRQKEDAYDMAECNRYSHRQDMAYVDELFDGLHSFVAVSLENDW